MEEPFDDFRNTATDIADRPASPVENAMMTLEAEQGKMYEMVTELARKLNPVLKRKFNPEASRAVLADAPSKDVDSHSQLVRQIDGCKNRTRSTLEIIDYLLMNTEV